jgi:hypothetical protein
MTDFQGNGINVGDKVAYVRKGCNSAEMRIGFITEIKTMCGRPLAFMDNGYYMRGATGRMIYRLGKNE